MKKPAITGLVLGVFVCLCGCGGKTKQEYRLENVVQESDTKISCTFDGVGHSFLLDFPEKTEGAPLVLMLHGYGGTAEGFRSATRFEEEANTLGYAVVYVTGAKDSEDATASTGWNSGLRSTGNKDVEFLVALAKHLQEEYGVDKERTYAVGFSNGAFMTHRLAMEASDTFSAVVSVAGKMPERIWENRNKKNDVSVLQITGEKDEAVPKYSDGTAKFAIDPAIEDVMEYWAESNGLEYENKVDVGPKATLTRYGNEEKKTKVWHLFIKDAHHSWYEEEISKVDTNGVILAFFEELK